MSFSFSCSIKKKTLKNTEENKSKNSELRISEEIIDVRTPKTNISIFDQILINSDGTFIPRIRSINVPETNQTLMYQISPQGEIKIKSISPPDTIRKKTIDILENITIDETIKTEEKIDISTKFNLGSLLKDLLNGVFPGLGDLFDSIFKIIGGIIAGVGLLILIVVIVIISLIRRIFRKK